MAPAKPYDGTAYVRLHDDATLPIDLGGGLMASRPLDAFLEAALRSNGLYCGAHGSQVTWSPLCVEPDQIAAKDATRPYASLAPATILCIPWIVTPGLRRVELSALARCGAEAGSPSALQTWLVLDGQQSSLGGTGRGLPLPIATSAAYAQRDVAVHLLGPAPITTVTNLRWVIQSGRSGVSLETPGAGTIHSLNRIGYPAFYADDLTDPHPNSVSLDTKATWDGESKRYFDHLSTRSYLEGSLFNDDRVMARPVTPAPVAPLGRLGKAHLSYLQVKAAEIRAVYDASLFVRPPQAYRAQIPIDARDEYQHLLTWQLLHQRPRCLWVGPQGERVPTDVAAIEYPPDYHRRFPQAQHDGVADPTRLLWIPFKPSTTNPTLKLLLNVIATSQAEGIAAKDLAELASLAPTCEWTVHVEVYQWQSGAISSPVIASADRQRLTHWPTDQGGGWAFLLQERLKVLNLGDYSYKEGLLYEEDLQLVQRLSVDVPIVYDPAGANPWPLVACVRLSRDNATLVRPDESKTHFDWSIYDDLVVTCVGASLWELPGTQDYPIPKTGDWTHPKKIRAAEWHQVTRAADVHFKRLGGRTTLSAPLGRGATPAKYSTSIAAPSWSEPQGAGAIRLVRPIEADASRVYLRVRAFMARARCRIWLKGADGAVSDSVTLEHLSTTPGWETADFFVDLPADHKGDSLAQPLRLFWLYWEAQRTGTGDGDVYQVEGWELDELGDGSIPNGT